MNVFENDHFLSQFDTKIDIRALTPAELLQLGMAELAYVKPVELDDGMAFAIHAADGSPMAVAVGRAMSTTRAAATSTSTASGCPDVHR